jgi:hypothetical protein
VHNPDLMASLAEKITGSSRSGESCTSCHPAAREAAPLFYGRAIPHRTHADKGIVCTTCHESQPPNHGKLKLTQEQCNGCHHTNAASAKCETCHDYQAGLFTGKLSGIPGAQPAAMSAAEVKCADCHKPGDNRVTRKDPAVCAGCHEAAFADTLKLWQDRGDSLMVYAGQKLKTLSRTSDSYDQYSKLLAAMRKDGSRSVHNPLLFTEWMKRIEATP